MIKHLTPQQALKLNNMLAFLFSEFCPEVDENSNKVWTITVTPPRYDPSDFCPFRTVTINGEEVVVSVTLEPTQ